MAVGPRDIDITREEVAEWLKEFDGKMADLRPYLQAKVDEKELPDEMVDTSERTDFTPSEVSVVDIILADLGSYL